MRSPTKFILLTALVTVPLTACGQNAHPPSDGPTKAAADVDAQRSAVLAAAEAFEALTEQAQAAPSDKLTKLIKDAQSASGAISGSLDPQARAKLQAHLQDIAKSEIEGNRTDVALASVEGYRTLVESAGDTGPVPRAVSLLDYAGFRYQADLEARPIRWDDAAEAADFASEQWTTIADRVTNAALKDNFAASLDGMRKAIDAKDQAQARNIATKELDLVDSLEGFFSS
jgi:hypothetical protein